MRTLSPRRRAGAAAADAEQTRWVWQSASLLLDYPDEQLGERLRLAARVAVAVGPALAEPLSRCVERLREADPVDLQADYVDTFDSRRRHNLFLTYFAHGDTRKRGMALLRFKQAYLDSGLDLDEGPGASGELPDHLCVVLEYGATADLDRARGLLMDHRAGLELLRIGLTDTDSRWAGAVQAVCATLTPLAGDERDAVRRLAAAGPPAEEVGLTPYATPGFDPGPASPPGAASAAVPLPTPTFPGAR